MGTVKRCVQYKYLKVEFEPGDKDSIDIIRQKIIIKQKT